MKYTTASLSALLIALPLFAGDENTVNTADLLPLPKSIVSRAVYHVKTHQINDFCCGYNCLYNACNLETACGIANHYSIYGIFKDACMRYLKSEKIDPMANVYNTTLRTLSRQILGLQQQCFMIHDPQYPQGFRMEFRECTKGTGRDHHEALRACIQKDSERTIDALTKIRDRLNKSRQPYEVVHFIFCADSHAVLISVVQNVTGRGLYVFDNMNYMIYEGSKTKLFLDYLCAFFSISQKSSFSGPSIPDIWSSTPGHMYRHN